MWIWHCFSDIFSFDCLGNFLHFSTCLDFISNFWSLSKFLFWFIDFSQLEKAHYRILMCLSCTTLNFSFLTPSLCPFSKPSFLSCFLEFLLWNESEDSRLSKWCSHNQLHSKLDPRLIECHPKVSFLYVWCKMIFRISSHIINLKRIQFQCLCFSKQTLSPYSMVPEAIILRFSFIAPFSLNIIWKRPPLRSQRFFLFRSGKFPFFFSFSVDLFTPTISHPVWLLCATRPAARESSDFQKVNAHKALFCALLQLSNPLQMS